MTRRPLPALTFALALAFLWLAAAEAVTQKREDDYVSAQAEEAVRGIAVDDFDARLAALRDYVRARVRNVDFPARGRPFLRDTAADTLRTGKGRCGEAARAFVNLARAAGLRAQRLYLDGPRPHVLAVVRPGDGRRLVVDPYETPYVPEVGPLDGLLGDHAEFTSYSTLGFRRLSLLRSLPSHELPLGPLNYLLENPHALASLLWLLASALALTLAEVLRRRTRRDTARSFAKQLTATAA
jgi:Transglutaminase-like superfamily